MLQVATVANWIAVKFKDLPKMHPMPTILEASLRILLGGFGIRDH
jgi:hypothetical protein